MEYGCSICRDDFNADVAIVAAKCGHVYHNRCINQWLNRSGTCPVCRARVSKTDLTQLFINHSFDSSRISIERSLAAMKEELNAKNLEIAEKDKKFEELQKSCAQSIRNAEKLDEEKTVIETSLRKLFARYASAEGRSIYLNLEMDKLQRENENLQNIKTMVEDCSKDTRHILENVGGQIDSLPTRRMATYCSILKRELGRLKEKKTKPMIEVRELKHRMMLLEKEKNKEIRRLKQQIQKLKDANSPSIHASPGSSSISVTPNVQKIGSLGCNRSKKSASFANMSFTNYLVKNQARAFLNQHLNRPNDGIKAPQMPALRFARSFSGAKNMLLYKKGF